MAQAPGLTAIEQEVQQLPFLPAVLTQLMAMDKDADDYFEKMVELARKDPSLSTLILKFANSAASASARPITSLPLAMSRIGTESVACYIASMGVARVFIPSKEEHKLLWRHSVETALYAEKCARLMPSMGVTPELAYIGGLLHDIGRFVMFDLAPEALADTPSSSWASPQELPQVEQQKIGYDHSQVGLIACRYWKLPKSLCNLVRAHHMYSIYLNEELPQIFRNLVLLVQFADFISIYLTKNPEWAELGESEKWHALEANCQHKDWGPVNLPLKEISDCLPQLEEQAQQWCESIGCA